MVSNTKVLTPFGLTMLIIIAIASLRDVPQVATYGLGSVTVYLTAATLCIVCVFIMSALAVAVALPHDSIA